MRAVNLIPTDQRGGASRGAGRSQGAAYAVLGLLAGLALLALVYGIARHQVSSRAAKAVALEAHAQQVQAEAAKLAPYSSFIALREQRVQAVSQLVNSRFDWAHAFHELGRVVPANVAITSLTGTVVSATGSASASGSASANSAPGSSATAGASGGGSVKSATPPGSVPTFAIGGCAKTQSTVALTLERLRLIDGVSAVSLVSSTKSGAPGGGGSSSGSTSCPASYPVFNVQVTFDALPASSATSSPPVSASVSSTSGATKSTGGSR
jgi:type II secretory pathway pseudopilin PulG